MKKTLITLSLFLVTLLGIGATVYAAGEKEKEKDVLGMNLNITTYTSEPCGMEGNAATCTGSGQMKRCKCTISASNGFINFIADIYKYVYFISLVIGVLMIVFLGITMSISGVGGSEEMQGNAKKKIFEILAGLTALGLLPFILKTVAPFFFT